MRSGAPHVGERSEKELIASFDELSVASTDFERWWATQGVLAREGGKRAFKHPTIGLMHYQQVSLSLAGWPDYRLTMLLSAVPARK